MTKWFCVEVKEKGRWVELERFRTEVEARQYAEDLPWSEDERATLISEILIPNCACGGFATHWHNGVNCCGGELCCPDKKVLGGYGT